MSSFVRRSFQEIGQEKQLKDEYSKQAAPRALAALAANRDILPGSGAYNIKCACPVHKGGQERTPAFFFSEESGRYYCFVCGIQGTAFDLITLLGGDGEAVYEEIRQGLKDTKIPIRADVRPLLSKCLTEVTQKLRDHLYCHFGRSTWAAELKWTENMYQKIDEALVELEKSQGPEIKGFFVQIGMDLARRPK